MTSVGLDIGARDVVIAIRHKNKVQKIKSFKNCPAGHQKIIQLCLKYLKYGKVIVVMESTGVYYFDLAVALTNIAKFEVKVINPRATKNFARAAMERNKTDKIDAQLLALFAEKMDYPLWNRPSDIAIELRYLARMLDKFIKSKAKSKNQLHALDSCDNSPDFVRDMVIREIEFYESIIAEMRQSTVELIKKDEQLSEWYELLQTIKGFGAASSIQLLGEIISIPEGLTHKQWVAFAGLDPRQFQSGTSINKKVGISRAGNRRIRTALFFPALAAARNDVYIKSYYYHLVENRNLAKLQAIVAVMRKLVHAIHGMLHQNASFDNRRFYAGPLKV